MRGGYALDLHLPLEHETPRTTITAGLQFCRSASDKLTLMACVVLRPGCQPSTNDIRDFCEANLGRFKTPKTLYFVDDLPRGPSGKVQRLKLPEFVESFTSSTHSAPVH